MSKKSINHWEYQHVDCRRDVSGENFQNGPIRFYHELTTASSVNLSKSYIRLLMSVTKPDGNALDIEGTAAPVFMAPEALFKSESYAINQVKVSEINDHCAQVAALTHRICCTRGRRETILKYMNCGDPKFSTRAKMFSNNVNATYEDGVSLYKPGFGDTTLRSFTPSTRPNLPFGVVAYGLNYDAATTILTVSMAGIKDLPNDDDYPPYVAADAFGDIVVGDTLRLSLDGLIFHSGKVISINAGVMELLVFDDVNIAAQITPLVPNVDGKFDDVECISFDDVEWTLNTNRTGFIRNEEGADLTDVLDGVDKIWVHGRQINILPELTTATTVTTNEFHVIDETTNWGIENVERIKNNRETIELELIFRPTLGIFQKDEWIVGHNFELLLFPHSTARWKKYFLESLNKNLTIGTDVDLYISNITFNVAVGLKHTSIKEGSQRLDFSECALKLAPIDTYTTLPHQIQIGEHTNQITMAVQDSRAIQGNSLYPLTKFKAGPVGSRIDTDLQTFSILVNGVRYPFVRPNSEKSEITDQFAQRYYENLNYTGQINHLADVETYAEFLALGPYYHYKLKPNSNQKATHITVTTTFREQFANGLKPNLLLFQHHPRAFELTIKNGRVVKVRSTQRKD